MNINGASEPVMMQTVPLHPKNKDVGSKVVAFGNKVFIEKDDAATLEENEEITLMRWGNVIVKRVNKQEVCIWMFIFAPEPTFSCRMAPFSALTQTCTWKVISRKPKRSSLGLPVWYKLPVSCIVLQAKMSCRMT